VALKVIESNPESLTRRTTDADERALLARVAEKRDQSAFRSLYSAYFQRLSRLLARMSLRPQDVEEVINDTFWVVWTKAGEFRGGSLLSTWIIGIAYRRALNTMRRERIRPVSDQPIDENMASVPSSAQDEEYSQWVRYGLEKLPVEQRLALELTYTLGHSCEEVAGILNCPVNTVKTRLFRARETLKQVLPALGGMTGVVQ
jgi:RNA polymerase sigma-70 factor (ECF subfamily)